MYVKSFELENIKGFDSLKFSLARPNGNYAGWTVFVGGNSSGKSTILRAIALALMGPEPGGRLMGSTSGWISKGATKARSQLTLTWDKDLDKLRKGGAAPGETFEAGVRWVSESKDSIPRFMAVDMRNARRTRIQTPERGPWSPNNEGWFSAGYGPMRRLTGSSSEAMRFSVSREVDSRFATLFREDAALSESEEWLRRMHARGLESKDAGIQMVLEGVKALLGDGLLPNGMTISRLTVDQVFIKDGRGHELPMRDISDGCRSVYATVLDLVHGMYEVYGADGLFSSKGVTPVVIDRPGVVIIDEIEAHLHPSWQRDIPTWLKTHFPRIQFLVSSHSPLIAQAADENGLFILPMGVDGALKARPASTVEYEKIRWGSAHKTVLGVAFGLHSTRTQWAQNQMVRWQNLNAKKKARAPLEKGEEKEWKEISRQIENALESEQAPEGFLANAAPS